MQQSPFTDMGSVSEIFTDMGQLQDIIGVIDEINQNADFRG